MARSGGRPQQPGRPRLAALAPAAARYAVIDSELTGLDPRRDSIVSLGGLRLAGGRIVLADRFYEEVRPASALTATSIVLHGITPEDVRGRPGIGAVLEEFAAFCAADILVGHFIEIDLGFLRAALRAAPGCPRSPTRRSTPGRSTTGSPAAPRTTAARASPACRTRACRRWRRPSACPAAASTTRSATPSSPRRSSSGSCAGSSAGASRRPATCCASATRNTPSHNRGQPPALSMTARRGPATHPAIIARRHERAAARLRRLPGRLGRAPGPAVQADRRRRSASLLCGVILVLGWLSYRSVKEVVTEDFNKQQLVLAKYAARQITHSLAMLRRSCTCWPRPRRCSTRSGSRSSAAWRAPS